MTPVDAPRFFRIAVHAHMENGDRKSAEETARHYMDVAKTDADRATAGLLMSEVASRFEKPAPVTVEPGDGKPILRRAEPTASLTPRPMRLAAMGQFVELDCRGKQARMIVQTDGGRRVFLIDDPARVLITGQSDWQVDMTCGPQKNRAKVEVGYELAGASEKGVDGVVRTLAFK